MVVTSSPTINVMHMCLQDWMEADVNKFMHPQIINLISIFNLTASDNHL